MSNAKRFVSTAIALMLMMSLGACVGADGRVVEGKKASEDASDTSHQPDEQTPDAFEADASSGTDSGTDTDVRTDASEPAALDWEHESDQEPTLVAKRLEDSVQLDGVLDEVDYQMTMAASFAGSGDNSVSMRILWDDDYLYIGATVTDSMVDYDPSAKAFQTDSVEVLIDTERDRTYQPNPDDLHFFGLTDGSSIIKRADAGGDFQTTNADLQSASSTTEDGYIVELRLAWSDIGQQPAEHLRMGLALGNNDLDAGQLEEISWHDSISLLRPSTYGDLRLGGVTPADDVPAPQQPPEPPENTTADCNYPDGPQPQTSNTVNLGDKGLQQGDSINSYLDQYFKGGNKVVIPAGTYSWNGRFGGSFSSDAVLCGDGMVVLEAPDNTDHNGTVTARSGAHVRIMNLTFKGVAAAGKNRIAFQTMSNSSYIQVINVSHPDGSPHDGHPSPIGFYVGKDNTGDILFKDCYVANFPNNGLYIDGHSGQVIVDGCVFENNLVDNLRMSGNDIARNVLVRMNGGRYNWSGRGIRFRYPGSPTLENIHIITNVNASPIQTGSASRMSGPVSATLENVFIENNGGAKAIDMKVGSATGNNVHITGSGNQSTSSVSGDVCTGSGCTAPETDITQIRP